MKGPWVTKDDLRGMQQEISSLTFDLRLAETKIASLKGDLVYLQEEQTRACTVFRDFQWLLYKYLDIEETKESVRLVKKGMK